MERYLRQLIDDLRNAAQRVPPPGELWDTVDRNNPAEVEDIAHVEQFLYGTPRKLSGIVGIDTIQLPPSENLTEEQTARLCHEMMILLKAYHFVPDFPAGLPVDIKYRLLREKWDSEQVHVGGGEVHIEFCNYEPDTCPFPEAYCFCRKFENDEEGQPGSGEDDDEDIDTPF